MTDQSGVRRIALSLPEATEHPDQFMFLVAGKMFAWVYPERVDPKRARVPNPEVLVVRVADDLEKQAMLAVDSQKFFTTPHYDGYPAILVRLPLVDEDELRQLLTDAWGSRAPKRLLTDRDSADR